MLNAPLLMSITRFVSKVHDISIILVQNVSKKGSIYDDAVSTREEGPYLVEEYRDTRDLF